MNLRKDGRTDVRTDGPTQLRGDKKRKPRKTTHYFLGGTDVTSRNAKEMSRGTILNSHERKLREKKGKYKKF